MWKQRVMGSKMSEAAVLSAYSDGYNAAIFRKKESTCPFSVKSHASVCWRKGHAKGKDVVALHSKTLKPRSYFHLSEEPTQGNSHVKQPKLETAGS